MPSTTTFQPAWAEPDALVASSLGARDGRWEQWGPDEQSGSPQLAVYAALSLARNSADGARNCSRWTPSGTTSSILVRCRK